MEEVISERKKNSFVICLRLHEKNEKNWEIITIITNLWNNHRKNSG